MTGLPWVSGSRAQGLTTQTRVCTLVVLRHGQHLLATGQFWGAEGNGRFRVDLLNVFRYLFSECVLRQSYLLAVTFIRAKLDRWVT